MKPLGQICYDSYCESQGWRSVHGEVLPRFENQDTRLQSAWTDAALDVAAAVQARYRWSKEAVIIAFLGGVVCGYVVLSIVLWLSKTLN